MYFLLLDANNWSGGIDEVYDNTIEVTKGEDFNDAIRVGSGASGASGGSASGSGSGMQNKNTDLLQLPVNQVDTLNMKEAGSPGNGPTAPPTSGTIPTQVFPEIPKKYTPDISNEQALNTGVNILLSSELVSNVCSVIGDLFMSVWTS